MDRLMSEVTGHLRELRVMIWSYTGSLDNQETLLKASPPPPQEPHFFFFVDYGGLL